MSLEVVLMILIGLTIPVFVVVSQVLRSRINKLALHASQVIQSKDNLISDLEAVVLSKNETITALSSELEARKAGSEEAKDMIARLDLPKSYLVEIMRRL